jgi:hypothetical protein
MTARIVLVADDHEHPLRLVEDELAAHADMPCPHCKQPLRILGEGRDIGGFDYYKAKGHCALAKCGKYVGEVRAYVSTIFGLEEDERVLNGRWKVY